MPTPLVATKLMIPPPRPRWVARPRLVHRLDAGQDVTLLSAPPGFGKTTLLSAWHAAAPEMPLAWLSLDPDDNDLVRFWSYLAAALETLAPLIPPGALSALPVAQMPLSAALAHLINTLSALPARVTLVLDDLHVIAEPQIHEALSYVVEHLPPTLHLVLATRTRPPIPLARLRAQGRLLELGADDLRFTGAETAAFLADTMGLTLGDADVAALEARTAGWAAGLQLAALSLNLDAAPEAPPGEAGAGAFSGLHPHVVDFFMEEVLSRQPPEVRSFLLATGFLDLLNASLCDAVTGRSDSAEMLRYLVDHNLFIVPHDEAHTWFRYHPLFGELLQARQARERTPEEVADLHGRASDWCAAAGYIPYAIGHAFLAADYDRAQALLMAHGVKMLMVGQTASVARWLAAFPPAWRTAAPPLDLLAAWQALAGAKFAEVDRLVDRVEAALDAGWLADDAANLADVRGEVTTLRATVAVNRQDYDRVAELGTRALPLDPQDDVLRSVVLLNLADAGIAADDLPTALARYAEVLKVAVPLGNAIITINAMSKLALIRAEQGQLALAAARSRETLAELQARGWDQVPATGLVFLGLAGVEYEWNDLEPAQAHAAAALELLERWGHPHHVTAALLLLARLAFARGDRAGADALLEETRRRAQQARVDAVARGALELQAHLAHRAGDDAAALRLYRRAAEGYAAPSRPRRRLPQVRALLLAGDPGRARALLDETAAYAAARGLVAFGIRVQALQALAAQALGQSARATETLLAAMTLAEPGGFVRTFLDEGPRMADALRAAAATGQLPDYVGRLLAGAHTAAAPPLPEPLSPRELEVLQMIAAQMSNPEIAAALVVSVNTVKTHVRRLYEKLGVSGRMEAVARAAELGLV